MMVLKIMLKSQQDERNIYKRLPKSENKRPDNFVQFIPLSDVLLFLRDKILFLIRTSHSPSSMSNLFDKNY